jgi:hypothetical protein
MNVVELFYFIGFFFSAFGVGWLLGKQFGAVGWIIGGIVGLVAWVGPLWWIKRYFEKSVSSRRNHSETENHDDTGRKP